MKRNREAVADLTPPRPPPSFLGKIKRIAKGRKAGRVATKNRARPPPPPSLAQGLDPPLRRMRKINTDHNIMTKLRDVA